MPDDASVSGGKDRRCGYSFGAVLAHGEWIAYLLHQWFSSRRGGYGERMQGPEGSRGLQTFWERLLDFYKVALWTSETVSGTDRQAARKCVHLCGETP